MKKIVTKPEELGPFIRDQRKKMFMSQLTFSEQIGMTQATLCHIERGSKRVRVDSIIKILDGLGYRLVIEKEDDDDT